ncbi:POT-type proton-dependent oligopeptide transporter [Dysgonomonas macrotermitis]|uniref:Dipeptide/tripeptide permease n=1 Tax=Dysgonomonas macrotermitis TaxID=1346286 RepID=A0A1M4TQH7_9BACT|nr:MFS transporter [Dysgonomonas macrotermitis]SHE46711.1 Dipeptide/tripeptide permease [Dysgonomonas macrotermitis]
MTKFSKAFWVANSVELLERLAYYAVFIVLTIYLSNVWGFSDIEAGLISGTFSALLYLLPTFVGAYADKIGFRTSILIAFLLLTVGYFGLGIVPTMFENAGLVKYGAGTGNGLFSAFFEDRGLVTFGHDTEFTGLLGSMQQWIIVPILLLIVIGGAFIKSVISGTVARETTESTRARGFAIFYMMVNIGAFTGKTVVDPLRKSLGDVGLVYLNYFSGTMTLLALIAVYFMYRSANTEGQGKSFSDIFKALGKVCTNGRLIVLILIVSGFWMVQQQMYATMPKYVIRLVGADASPGWIANVNPFVVFLMVNIITTLMQKRSALASMTVGMFIIPISAAIMATGSMMGDSLVFGTIHPVTLMMIVGIAFQALAECFISPRFLEYFSLQSPKGEEGLYLGFSHLHSFVSSILAFGISGFLLERYCPDPRGYTPEAYADVTAHAHYIWFFFFGIGLVSAIALVIYGKVTRDMDAKKNLAEN